MNPLLAWLTSMAPGVRSLRKTARRAGASAAAFEASRARRAGARKFRTRSPCRERATSLTQANSTGRASTG